MVQCPLREDPTMFTAAECRAKAAEKLELASPTRSSDLVMPP